jgi:predicted small secreted protein
MQRTLFPLVVVALAIGLAACNGPAGGGDSVKGGLSPLHFKSVEKVKLPAKPIKAKVDKDMAAAGMGLPLNQPTVDKDMAAAGMGLPLNQPKLEGSKKLEGL